MRPGVRARLRVMTMIMGSDREEQWCGMRLERAGLPFRHPRRADRRALRDDPDHPVPRDDYFRPWSLRLYRIATLAARTAGSVIAWCAHEPGPARCARTVSRTRPA